MAPDGKRWTCACHGAKLSGGDESARQRVLVATRSYDRSFDADRTAGLATELRPLLLPHMEVRKAASYGDAMPAKRDLRDAGAQTLQDAGSVQRRVARYELAIHTAALGGTSAQVAVQLCGSGGEAVGPLHLGDGGGAGLHASARIPAWRPTLSGTNGRFAAASLRQAGKAVFTVEAPDVGPLKHLRVGHDGSGDSPSWHLDRVIVNVTPVGRTSTCGASIWYMHASGTLLIRAVFIPHWVMIRVMQRLACLTSYKVAPCTRGQR